MYCLSVFCFVCLSMNKKKKLNKISSDLAIFHMLNSCSYDTNWMEDTSTMYICGKCHNQLYSVCEFIEMCRKNSSLLQGYVALLKHGSYDIARPIDELEERKKVNFIEDIMNLHTVEIKLEDDINVNVTHSNDTIADPIIDISVKDEMDVFMNESVDIKDESLILKSNIDSNSVDKESNHVLDQMKEFDAETESKPPIIDISMNDEMDAFMNESVDIKDESLILKSAIDCNSVDKDHVLDQMKEFDAETESKRDLMFQTVVSNESEIINKRDLETSIRNDKQVTFASQYETGYVDKPTLTEFRDERFGNESSNICKNIQIEHMRDQNGIFVTNVLNADDNIKTQFSSNSEAIYINNIINSNTVQNKSINKVNIQNQTESIDGIQLKESTQDCEVMKMLVSPNIKLKITKVCLSQQGADIPSSQDQPNELSVYSPDSYCLNQANSSTQTHKMESLPSSSGFGLKRLSNKLTSVLKNNPVKRTKFNKTVTKTQNIPVSYSTGKGLYMMLPVGPTVPLQMLPNRSVMDTVPSVSNNAVVRNADMSYENSEPIAATNKTQMEPPYKCDICQGTLDTFADLRLHLVTHSGMTVIIPEKIRTGNQKTEKSARINKNENYESMFINHMIRTGTL